MKTRNVQFFIDIPKEHGGILLKGGYIDSEFDVTQENEKPLLMDLIYVVLFQVPEY